jgi:hypothetical protein
MTKGNSSSLSQFPGAPSDLSLPLFEKNSSTDHAPGSLNDDSLVRAVITDAIKRCRKGREQIAEDMQRLLGVPVTARMIGSFTSESKELHRWPGAWDRAFCFATGDFRLLCCRVEAAGFHVITRAEAELLELGKEHLRRKRASENVELLEKRLLGVDL